MKNEVLETRTLPLSAEINAMVSKLKLPPYGGNSGASCRIRTNDPEITNHVLWPTELKRQVGKLTTSHRYNRLPLLRSSPGGFTRSWSCRTYPGTKVDIIYLSASVFGDFFKRNFYVLDC